jgi:hypothetical protein
VPAPADEPSDESDQEAREGDDRESNGVLAADDIEPTQPMAGCNRFEVLLYDERNWRPRRDQQPKASREPSERAEASDLETRLTGSDQRGMSLPASNLTGGTDGEDQRDYDNL